MSSPAGWHPDPNDPRVQRYWDGSGWTGQRVWDGAQWVDAAPAPPHPPHGNRRWWWIGGGLLAALVVGIIVAATAGGSSHHGGAADPGGSVPTAPVHATPGAGQAMLAWENTKNELPLAGGKVNGQSIVVAERDVVAIGKDYSDGADQTTLEHDCFQLKQTYGIPTDSPNRTVNANLSKASEYLVSGSVDCGVDDQAASAELNKAIDYLNAAVSEIKSLGG